MNMIKFPIDRPYTQIEAMIDYFCNIKRSRPEARISIKGTAEKWNWPRTTTSDFIKYLESVTFPSQNRHLYDFIHNGLNHAVRHKSVTSPSQKKPTRKEKEPRVFVYDEKDFEEIIRYLNEKTGRDYHKTTAHIKYIKDRLGEGYTLDNFKSVIDIKVKEWLGTEMSKYLRPQTLFGGKFDSYLNQKFDKKKFVKGDKKLKTTWSGSQNESEGS